MSKGDLGKTSTANRKRKDKYWSLIHGLLTEYNKILVVTADNVRSNQMHQIRRALRGKAVLLMGKNTMIRKAIHEHVANIPKLDVILPYVKGNVGFVLTNGDVREIANKIVGLKLEAFAKVGAVAPVDVVIPKGNTLMEPTKIAMFHALSIPSAINRGTIEISRDIHLLSAGQRVSLSHATLLRTLGIKPFQYGLKVVVVYDEEMGAHALFPEWHEPDLVQAFMGGVANIAALSLRIGYPTVASVPHSVVNGFMNLVALTGEGSYSFPAAEGVKNLLSSAPALNGPVIGSSTAFPDPDETTDTDDDMGGLFCDEDDEEEEDEERKNKKNLTDDEDEDSMGGLFGGDDNEEGY